MKNILCHGKGISLHTIIRKREKKIRGRKNQGENKSEGDQIFF